MIFASVPIGKNDILPGARVNAQTLVQRGGTALYNVDATKLQRRFPRGSFQTVIFQFPNVASRQPVYGRNPNSTLVRRFLRSAVDILSRNGKALITTVDSPYYLGAFRLFEAAEQAGYSQPKIHPFFPKRFPGYKHENTDGSESALDRHDKFCTLVLEK